MIATFLNFNKQDEPTNVMIQIVWWVGEAPPINLALMHLVFYFFFNHSNGTYYCIFIEFLFHFFLKQWGSTYVLLLIRNIGNIKNFVLMIETL
jgi:hypothetical protein